MLTSLGDLFQLPVSPSDMPAFCEVVVVVVVVVVTAAAAAVVVAVAVGAEAAVLVEQKSYLSLNHVPFL